MQSPTTRVGAPSFEAISIKESKGTRIPVQWQGPRFIASGIPLQTLLIVAYGVPMYQLAELPEWVRATRWEIRALASRPPLPAEQWPWLRTLLEQRFGIVARTEMQDPPCTPWSWRDPMDGSALGFADINRLHRHPDGASRYTKRARNRARV